MNVAMFKKAAAIVGLVFGLSIEAPSASAQNLSNPGVVPPDSNEFGNTYGEWSA